MSNVEEIKEVSYEGKVFNELFTVEDPKEEDRLSVITSNHEIEFTREGYWGEQFVMIDIPKSDIPKETIVKLNQIIPSVDSYYSLWFTILESVGFVNPHDDPKYPTSLSWTEVDGHWRTYINFYNSPFKRIRRLFDHRIFKNTTMKIYYDTRYKIGYERIVKNLTREKYFVDKTKPELIDILKLQIRDWKKQYQSNIFHLQFYDDQIERMKHVIKKLDPIRIGYINVRKYIDDSLHKEYKNDLYGQLRLPTYFEMVSNTVSDDVREYDLDYLQNYYSFEDLYKSFEILRDLNTSYRVGYQMNDYENPNRYYFGCVRDWIEEDTEIIYCDKSYDEDPKSYFNRVISTEIV
jgi:hypothetical protein